MKYVIEFDNGKFTTKADVFVKEVYFRDELINYINSRMDLDKFIKKFNYTIKDITLYT